MTAVLDRPPEEAAAPPEVRPFVTIQPNGKVRFNLHPGQQQAYRSRKRFVLVLSGTQGGKTSFGPLWLLREMRMRGPGDYMVVTPTYPLLELKALPEFKRLFETMLKLGRYVASPSRRFIVSEEGAIKLFGEYDPLRPTQVLFGHAQDPESLESATAKAAWLDEAGQNKFKLGSWEAILRRLSLAMGRVLLTTTPYNLGWLKQRLWDPWQKAIKEGREHPDIEVVRFDSTENPTFPKAEFERARDELPDWKFKLFYQAIWSRPAGMVYSSFDQERHTMKRFEIPDEWPRYLGLDFGPVHTAGMFYAAKPNTRLLFGYREYLHGDISTKQHVTALLKGEPLDRSERPRIPLCYGGSASEGQWRLEFLMSGLVVGEPSVKEVEVGITRVFAAHRRDEIIVFDDLEAYLAQKLSYSYETDETGEPLGTGAIEDKHDYHLLDAERYIIGTLRDAPASGAERVRPIRHGDPGQPAATRAEAAANFFGHSIRAGTVRRG